MEDWYSMERWNKNNSLRQKLLFIYNPKAGKARIRSKLSDILDIFAEANYEITICPTRETGEARVIASNRSPEYDLLVCSGGDGTLDEVVAGMMQSSFVTPIGYIPAGSTNDFGESLRLPKNLVNAAKIVVNGKNFECDIGSFNQDYFVYVAAFGLFTDVTYETEQEMKNILGHMAYILEGMKRLSTIRSYSMKLTWEDNIIEDEFIFGMITNSLSVGGFKHIIGKKVHLDDGLFEVTLIRRPKNPLELNNIMIALLNRDISTDTMYSFRTSELRIVSREPILWNLDGEYGGQHTEVEIKNLCKAISIRIA